MNRLDVTENNCVGSEEDLETLSKKDSARVLVLSDSHGNYKIVRKIIENFGSDCDAIVFCGDTATEVDFLITEAGNDDEFCKKVPSVLAFVAGNCDTFGGEILPLCIHLPNKYLRIKIPEAQVLDVAGHRIFICHGHKHSVEFGIVTLEQNARAEKADVALYGHTHVANERNYDEFKAVNPGSCNKPRGGQNPGFAIITLQNKVVDAAFIQMENLNAEDPGFSVYTPF